MKSYSVISFKNQGVYKKNEIISILKNIDLNEYFGFKANHVNEKRYINSYEVTLKEI